jgi:hypothetical protein
MPDMSLFMKAAQVQKAFTRQQSTAAKAQEVGESKRHVLTEKEYSTCQSREMATSSFFICHLLITCLF